VVYHDTAFDRLFDALESLVAPASESLQHQNLAAIVRPLASLFPRLPAAYQPRAEALVRRVLPTLGKHVLTGALQLALVHLLLACRTTLTRMSAPDRHKNDPGFGTIPPV
jgi:hypothetical protein